MEGERCIGQEWVGKMSPVLEPHNSTCPRFFPESKLSMMGPWAVERVALVDIPQGVSAGQALGKVLGVVLAPGLHNSVLDPAQISAGWSIQEPEEKG